MSEVLSYNLEWDGGSAGITWVELVGETVDYLLTTYTVSSSI